MVNGTCTIHSKKWFGRPDCCFQCNDARLQNEIAALLSLRKKEKRPDWHEKELQALYDKLSKGIRERVKEDGPVVTPADKFIARPPEAEEAAAAAAAAGGGKRKLGPCKSKGCKNKTAALEGLCKDCASKALKAAASAASAEAEASGAEAVEAADASDKEEEEE